MQRTGSCSKLQETALLRVSSYIKEVFRLWIRFVKTGLGRGEYKKLIIMIIIIIIIIIIITIMIIIKLGNGEGEGNCSKN